MGWGSWTENVTLCFLRHTRHPRREENVEDFAAMKSGDPTKY